MTLDRQRRRRRQHPQCRRPLRCWHRPWLRLKLRLQLQKRLVWFLRLLKRGVWRRAILARLRQRQRGWFADVRRLERGKLPPAHGSSRRWARRRKWPGKVSVRPRSVTRHALHRPLKRWLLLPPRSPATTRFPPRQLLLRLRSATARLPADCPLRHRPAFRRPLK